MDEPIFASFKPIIKQTNKNKEEIMEYYRLNNIIPRNDFLSRYLESIPKDIDNPTSTTSTTPEISIPIKKTYIKSNPIKNPIVNTKPILTLPPQHKEIGKQVIDFYINKGLTKEQAAGIAGNYFAESNFKTTALGDNKTSFGIAQWHGPRLEKLKEFAKEKGTPVDDFTTQLEFTWHELQTSEKRAFSKLKLAKTAKEAARLFSDHFERPKLYNIKREQKAEELYSS